MSKRTFLMSADWRKIAVAITDQLEERRQAEHEAQDFASIQYERGWVDALRSVIALPEQLLKDEGHEENREETNEDDEKSQEEKAQGIVSLVPKSTRTMPPRRSEFFRG